MHVVGYCDVMSGREEREERGTIHVWREREERRTSQRFLVGQVDVRTPV